MPDTETFIQTDETTPFPPPVVGLPQIDTKSSTDAQAAQLGVAIRSARHRSFGDAPFVLAYRPGGGRPSLVSMRPGGMRARAWGATYSEMSMLASDVAEPVRWTANGPRRSVWAPAVLRSARQQALEPGDGATSCSLISARPVVMSDGAVLSEPGWYPGSEALLLARCGDWSGYRVDTHLDRSDAQEALDLIDQELLGDFRFAHPSDHARALAFILTASSRNLVPTSPVWLFLSGSDAVGKDLLAQAGMAIANGTARHVWGLRAEEARRMLANSLADNIGETHFVHRPGLASWSAISSRFLSEIADTPDGVIATASGTFVPVGPAWARRSMSIIMDRPAQGAFRHPHLLGWAVESRPRLLSACHTVLARGLREGLTPPALKETFPEWSRTILGPMSDLHAAGTSRSVAELALDGRGA